MKVAWPAVSVSGAPRLVTPSLNCTVPEGVPEPEVTVAVNETDWPTVDGFGPAERTSAVAVAAWATWWATAADVLVAKLESPEYTPVMECAPTARVVVAKVACPAVRVSGAP